MLKKIALNPFIFFPVFTLIVLWPLSSFLFSLKNDALTYYYPVRTLISDALNNGELPLWTPYINMGYPLHADMQSGAWSPVVWLFSFFTKYSLGAFHTELFFYLAAGAIGFYYLCRSYQWSKQISFIIAISYQFSGFITDSIQFFSCISSACYIPFIFLFVKKLIDHQQMKDAVFASLFIYLLFTGGYPALFIINFYFLAAYFLFRFFQNNDKKIFVRKIALPILIMIALVILLDLPAIISFVSHLDYIERGHTQTLAFVLEN